MLLSCSFVFSQNDVVNVKGAQTITGLKKFSVSPTAPTLAPGTNTTQLATTAFVTTAVSGGGQTLQQTVANGSYSTQYGNDKAFLIDILGDPGSAALHVTTNMVVLATSAAAGGFNGLQASPIKTALQYAGAQRLLFDSTSSNIDVFPLKYTDETTLRTGMVNASFIPSVGKVQDMIDVSKAIIDADLNTEQSAASLNAKYPSVALPYVVYAPNVNASMVYVKISSTKWMASAGTILE